MDSVCYRCDKFQIEPGNHRFSRDGVDLALEPRVFAVIVQLLAHPGTLVTRNQLLDAVWGHRYVTPSTLNRVIALARRAFADETEEPKFIRTVHGAGYRYIGPIEREDPLSVQPQARFAPPPIARLPARIDALIGRENEIAQLAAMLADHRAVTLLGSGGIGKTQCALEFARRHAAEYPDGVWFFDLAPLQSGDEWLKALAMSLAIPPAGEIELLTEICPLLRDRRALFLIDNCDRIAVSIGALVFALLQGCADLKVVVTSQQPLNFVGEQRLHVPPLPLPPASTEGGIGATPDVQAAPAVALLTTRVKSVQPAFVLNDANAAIIVEICRRLDGIPLALELAAARFSLLSPEQVLGRLEHRFRFLVSDLAGRDARHRSLLVLLDWSFSLLSLDEQRMLTWLGVFVQGWTVDAAIDLAASHGHDPETVVDLLMGLANKSLVTVDQTLSPPRYRLLETVREFALERLQAAGEEQRARDAHLAFVVRMSRRAHEELLNGRMRERIGQLVHEHGNIETALEYAVAKESTRGSALSIVGSLLFYFKSHGAFMAGQRMCERALAESGSIDTLERGRALLCLGIAGLSLGSPQVPTAFLGAIRIARKNNDPWAESCANAYYALWLANGGRAVEADRHGDSAEEIAERLEDPWLRGLVGLARGWAFLAHGAYSHALAVLEPVRRLGQDLHQQHFIDMYIGLALFGLGRHAAAAEQWLTAMNRATEVDNIRGVAGSIEGCGYVAEKIGDHADAARYLGKAGRIRARTEAPLFSFWTGYHQRAHAGLLSALGPKAYEVAVRSGREMRDEDAANEVASRLGDYAGRPTTAAP